MDLTRAVIEQRAKELLQANNSYAIPVDPVVLANRLGIKVSNAVFSEQTLAGMVARRGDQVSILVNQADPPFRKRFTIAHELGHYLFHLPKDGEIVDREADLFRVADADEIPADVARWREIEANRFAAALLMDADHVRDEWSRLRSVSAMARLFNVSETAMGIRIGTLGLE